ncbi:MAG: AAA family ATPase [Candidatus Latescibacterota bacterium]
MSPAFSPPLDRTFFVFGPRGVGKSTWLRQTYPDAHVVDLLSEETYQRLLADPSLFAAEVRPLAPERWVVIDEVQRLPSLLNEVHRFTEERRQRFVLCGSSAPKLRRAGVNLLAGRAVRRFMHPFVPEELGNTFDLAGALRHGLMPIVWDSADRSETLAAYSQLYLREEVQAEALVRNLPGFARFLPVAALSHGQTVNVTNIAREAGVARTTVVGYLQILEETLLCFWVEAYQARLRVRERRLPRLYWCDPGIVRSMRRARGDPVEEERGALFEGLVAQLLRAYRDYRSLCDAMCYWSSHGARDVEVDFLLQRDAGWMAVEAKSGARFTETWCRGLPAVAPLQGLRRRLLVYPRGPRLRTEDGIDVLPFDEFAREVAAGTQWDA